MPPTEDEKRLWKQAGKMSGHDPYNAKSTSTSDVIARLKAQKAKRLKEYAAAANKNSRTPSATTFVGKDKVEKRFDDMIQDARRKGK